MIHGFRLTPAAGGSPRKRRLTWLVAASLIASVAPASAQHVVPTGVVIDNDHFAYWLPPADRPDREYTHGLRISYSLDPQPSLSRVVAPNASPCDGYESPHQPCTTVGLHLRQQIFTPTPWKPEPGERPYAGWLAAGLDVDIASEWQRGTYGLEIGVTGRPSLAEAMQTRVHRWMGHGDPVGWEEQIAFEPAFTVHATRGVLLMRTTPEFPVGINLAASGGAAAGTARTGLHAGAEARAGIRPPHPWKQRTARGAPAWTLYGIAAVRQDLVLRNLMLDGNTFRASNKVDKFPLVWERVLGVGLRYRRFGVEYRAVTSGREYATQAAAHRYGSFAVSLPR